MLRKVGESFKDMGSLLLEVPGYTAFERSDAGGKGQTDEDGLLQLLQAIVTLGKEIHGEMHACVWACVYVWNVLSCTVCTGYKRVKCN